MSTNSYKYIPVLYALGVTVSVIFFIICFDFVTINYVFLPNLIASVQFPITTKLVPATTFITTGPAEVRLEWRRLQVSRDEHQLVSRPPHHRGRHHDQVLKRLEVVSGESNEFTPRYEVVVQRHSCIHPCMFLMINNVDYSKMYSFCNNVSRNASRRRVGL